jgi:hypothetical protein
MTFSSSGCAARSLAAQDRTASATLFLSADLIATEPKDFIRALNSFFRIRNHRLSEHFGHVEHLPLTV